MNAFSYLSYSDELFEINLYLLYLAGMGADWNFSVISQSFLFLVIKDFCC